MSWRQMESEIKDLLQWEMMQGPSITDRLRMYRTMIPARPRFSDLARRAGGRSQTPQDYYMRHFLPSVERLWNEEVGLPWNCREELPMQDNVHKIEIDVEHYSAEDLAVKTIGRFVLVKGQHSQRQERLCWASRQFIKKYKVPDNVDLDQIRCDLVQDHYLVITAPIKASATGKYRAVPIRSISTLMSRSGSPGEAEEELVEEPPVNADAGAEVPVGINAGAQMHVGINTGAQMHLGINADAHLPEVKNAYAQPRADIAIANGIVAVAPANGDPAPALD